MNGLLTNGGHKKPPQMWASCPFCVKTFEVNPSEHLSIVVDGKKRFVCGTCAPRIEPPQPSAPEKGNGNGTPD